MRTIAGGAKATRNASALAIASAAVVGDVVVLGYLTYLEVWELDKFQQRMLSDPYTEEDEAAIARLGI